ncbi:MAG: hypothetical protein GC153_05895 [Alphaproteobacteria bacterium]|nr:hypothetical protein [Alphaproteobacteria bacterium]
MRKGAFYAAATLALATASMPAFAAETSSQPAWTAHLILNARLRQEWVDQTGFTQDASGLTLRTRFGFDTPAWKGVSVLIEGEIIAYLSNRFNDTVNGRTTFPVIADPEASELNRAQISYAGPQKAQVVVGRQWLSWDDQRFIGPVGFRQNDQTFDAVSVSTGDLFPVTINYAFIDRVHRVFGGDHPLGEFDSRSHIIDARKTTPIGTVAVYSFLLDLRNAPALSSATYGARLTGAHGGLSYRIEYARQSEYGNNPASYSVGYFRASADFSHGWWTLGAGGELLGGDGANAFQTPLATLHKFQGWADAFTTTPTDGLHDLYLRVEARWMRNPLGAPIKFKAEAHDFTSKEHGKDFGSEIDLSAGIKLAPRLSVEAASAFFDGGAFGPADRTKIWLATTFDF